MRMPGALLSPGLGWSHEASHPVLCHCAHSLSTHSEQLQFPLAGVWAFPDLFPPCFFVSSGGRLTEAFMVRIKRGIC